MIKIALLAVVGALLSVQLKSGKPEYGIYVSVGVSLLLFGGIVERLGSFVTMFRNLEELSGINPEYLSILLKMIGITYVGEFASGICKECGIPDTCGSDRTVRKADYSIAESSGFVGIA